MNITIEIDWDDVVLILGKSKLKTLKKGLNHATCPACKRHGNAILAVKDIWLNHIGDIILDGWCKDCGYKLSKYFEANHIQGSYDQAMAIRELKIDILKNYTIKR